MIFSDQYIDIGSKTLSSILASTAEFFNKVSLDLSQIKNMAKVYTSYKIPREEKIIAYCRGTVPLFGITSDGIVFTDKAFYPYPKKDLNLQSNRILYVDLGKYIITKEFDDQSVDYLSSHGGVILHDDQGLHRIYEGTLIAKNIAAAEIFTTLVAIQDELCKKNDIAKKQMDSTVESVFDCYSKKLRIGELLPNDELILRSLIGKISYSYRAISLIGETVFRRGNMEKYKLFLEYIRQKASKNLLESLSDPYLEFADNYIEDLSNLNLLFSSDFLAKTLKNMNNDIVYKQGKSQAIIHTLLLIRASQFNMANILINHIKDEYGIEVSVPIEALLRVYGKMKMRKVFTDIVAENNIDDDCLGITDGIGLSPLHYAIIMSNTEYVTDILSMHDWTRYIPPIKDQEIREIYDYSVVSYIAHGYVSDDIMCNTDRRMKEISDLIDALNDQANEAHELSKETGALVIDGNRNIQKLWEERCYEEYYEAENAYNNIQNADREIRQTFSNILDELEKLEEERSARLIKKEEQVIRVAAKLRKSTNPIVKFLINIFEDTDARHYIENIYFEYDKNGMRLYQHENYCILLPQSIELDTTYRQLCVDANGLIRDEIIHEESGVSKDSFPTRPYGTSWFSMEARRNRICLNTEYKQLAKQYHPDICKASFAHEVFTDILREYEELSRN